MPFLPAAQPTSVKALKATLADNKPYKPANIKINQLCDTFQGNRQNKIYIAFFLQEKC